MPKIPVPTIFEITSAVALNNPSWRSRPGFTAGAGTLSMFHHLRTVVDHRWFVPTHPFIHSPPVAPQPAKSEDGKSRYDPTDRGGTHPGRAQLGEPPRLRGRVPCVSSVGAWHADGVRRR